MPTQGWLIEIGNPVKRRALAKSSSGEMGGKGGWEIIAEPLNQPTRLLNILGTRPRPEASHFPETWTIFSGHQVH
jgi:hypothetical protein